MPRFFPFSIQENVPVVVIASKGGQSVPDEKRSFSQDRELASEAGKKGGQESGGNRNRGGR